MPMAIGICRICANARWAYSIGGPCLNLTDPDLRQDDNCREAFVRMTNVKGTFVGMTIQFVFRFPINILTPLGGTGGHDDFPASACLNLTDPDLRRDDNCRVTFVGMKIVGRLSSG